MKKHLAITLLSIATLFHFGCSSKKATVQAVENPPPQKVETAAEIPETVPSRLTWPRVIEHPKGKLKVYQPQIEKWEKESIEYRMAIEILLKEKPDPVYGALWLSGTTDSRLDERLVKIKNIQVSKISIPSATSENIKKLEHFINEMLKGKDIVISLDRVVADVATEPNAISTKKTSVNMDPPNILLSQEPAVMLIIVDDPVLQPISGAGLSLVANANMDLFYEDTSKKYYLFIGEQWLSTTDLGKAWQSNVTPPDSFIKIPDDFERAYVKDLLGTKSDKIVNVLLTQPPAELILIDGPPSMEAISETGLMYVKNTEQNLFLNKSEGMYYYMSSGRWFRSKRLKGPWAAVDNNLPEDFSKIPDDHPKSAVLVSVPGTSEAKEAVVEAQIPRKIKVNREKTTLDVSYHGKPEFRLIEGTELAYGVNTTKDVIRFDSRYYCCYEGVWFISKEPDDSWEVCDSVPDEIYTIPSTDPKYNLTYVYVYQYDSETVTFGYTSGYEGTYVTEQGTVVQGTGHTYKTYVYYYNGYPYYYWYPYTYCYWGYSYYYYTGPYYYYPYYYYGYGKYHYGQYGSGYSYHYGPYSYTHYAGSYKGANFTTQQYKGPYGHWGESEIRRGDDWIKSWHDSNGNRTVGGIETSKGGKGAFYKGNDHQGGIYKTGDNDLYVGRDGNVYRRDEDGWSKRENGTWDPVSREKPSSTDMADRRDELKSKQGDFQRPEKGGAISDKVKSRPSEQISKSRDRTRGDFKSSKTRARLQKDRAARSRGNYRTQKHYSRSRSSFGGRSRGGRGGMRGGRGRR